MCHNPLKNTQKTPVNKAVLLQKVENHQKAKYLFKTVDFFVIKVYNYAYRMNIFAKIAIWRN